MGFRSGTPPPVCLWHGRHASDGSEKERDETRAKRRDVGPDLFRKRRFRQQHSGNEGAQHGRKAQRLAGPGATQRDRDRQQDGKVPVAVSRCEMEQARQQIPVGRVGQHQGHHERGPGPDRAVPLARRSQTELPGGFQQDLFYCYGYGHGGDIIRFAELYYQVKFPQALAVLRQWRGVESWLHEDRTFLLHSVTPPQRGGCLSAPTRSRSPELIGDMRIGYAPGGCLRGWLTQLGYPLRDLREAGLVTAAGYDAYRVWCRFEPPRQYLHWCLDRCDLRY
jgi:hypothetical protein